MGATSAYAQVKVERKKALRLLIANSVFWTVGSCLALGPVLLYFHSTTRWDEISVGVILFFVASVLGISRLSTPLWIRLLGDERRVAMLFSGAAALVLLTMPLAIFLASNDSLIAWRIAAGIFLVYFALDAVGNTAIWSWIAQATPQAVRGKYLGIREMLRLLGLAPTFVVLGFVLQHWRSQRTPMIERILDLSPVIILGSVFLLLATFVLFFARQRASRRGPVIGWSEPWFKMLRVPAFMRLLMVVVWITFFTALSIPAEFYLQRRTFTVTTTFSLFAFTILGQAFASRWIGPTCDRIGSKPVLFFFQALAAFVPFAMLFAAIAPQTAPSVAAILAIAQAGVYLALNTMALKIAPRIDRSRYLVMFFTISAVCFGSGILAGELLVEIFSFQYFRVAAWRVNAFQYVYYISWSTRLMGLVFIASLIEPAAATWWKSLRSRWQLHRANLDSTLVQTVSRHPLD